MSRKYSINNISGKPTQLKVNVFNTIKPNKKCNHKNYHKCWIFTEIKSIGYFKQSKKGVIYLNNKT